jgi:hypothetical protein
MAECGSALLRCTVADVIHLQILTETALVSPRTGAGRKRELLHKSHTGYVIRPRI